MGNYHARYRPEKEDDARVDEEVAKVEPVVLLVIGFCCHFCCVLFHLFILLIIMFLYLRFFIFSPPNNYARIWGTDSTYPTRTSIKVVPLF